MEQVYVLVAMVKDFGVVQIVILINNSQQSNRWIMVIVLVVILDIIGILIQVTVLRTDM